MPSKDVNITDKSIEAEDPEVLPDLPDDLSTDELFHIVNNVPYSMALNLGQVLGLRDNDIDNIMFQITYRKPEVMNG